MSQSPDDAPLFGLAAEVAERAKIVRAYLEADTPFPPVRWSQSGEPETPTRQQDG